jgi:hypothetical protein
MNRVLKLSLVLAAIAGAAVGTMAFLRARQGAANSELLDYDEASTAVSDVVGTASDSVKDVASDLQAAASEVVDS